MQGKKIPFNPKVLNEIFSLKDIDDEDVKIKIKQKDEHFFKEALKAICPNGVRINTGSPRKPLHISSSCILETARPCGKFSSRLGLLLSPVADSHHQHSIEFPG
ncbi:uncharacterized protein LOC132615337 isoform X2 [Lycium barbarum]|uniref:uncharacterized protein LOC132615337 isoform X2 n=1 Tax=Lycium barbarum TaxID=112863 RepID=UPI00293F26A8|nr:uncharacterized protein LOC132615337 isoform X2 [Lycium barbarum]